MEYASLIHEKLVELDGDNAEYYDANLAELLGRLETLDQQIRVATRTVPEAQRRLLTYHDSWPYWADRYGFTVVGAVQPQDLSEPTASDIAGLIDQIQDQQLPAIFGSEGFPGDALETIAAETGAAYAGDLSDDDLPGEAGDPNHSYVGLMVENMRIMIPALGGSAAPLDIVETGLVFEDGPSTAEYPQ
jgi:ABC-type Zn uptake system ZnuABC Zn-binding protein ZnuA